MSTPAEAKDEAVGTDEQPSRASVGHAALSGLGVAAGVGLVWAALAVVLDFHLGLLVVAAVGGWLIGGAVARVRPGAWPVAVGSALVGWSIAAALSYVLSQLLLPQAVTPLAERLSLAGLLNYTSQTFDLVQAAAIAILVVVAWRSAR